jgi:hypothetical protein
MVIVISQLLFMYQKELYFITKSAWISIFLKGILQQLRSFATLATVSLDNTIPSTQLMHSASIC